MPLETIQLDTTPNPTASVIWLHGLGADGNDFVPIVNELDLKGVAGIRFIFPHAEQIPVTINGGYVMRAWYDIIGTDLTRREDTAGLAKSQAAIEELIALEIKRGVPAARIVLAGFSQGCAMTLLTGLRYPQRLAGLMGLSGYLPRAAQTIDERSAANIGLPIFMGHGLQDGVVAIDRAEASRELLTSLGYPVEWHAYRMPHSVCPEEIDDIGHWLRKVLPA
jgi:phospholipase/carboxylesterase